MSDFGKSPWIRNDSLSVTNLGGLCLIIFVFQCEVSLLLVWTASYSKQLIQGFFLSPGFIFVVSGWHLKASFFYCCYEPEMHEFAVVNFDLIYYCCFRFGILSGQLFLLFPVMPDLFRSAFCFCCLSVTKSASYYFYWVGCQLTVFLLFLPV